MPKDYVITQFKVGNFKDQNGNTWCDMALEGISEPVRIVVKDPSKFHEGMTIYGTIKDMTSQNGKPYQRFYREQKASAQGSTFDSNGAKFGNSLKIAADFYLTRGISEMDEDQFVTAVNTLANRIYTLEPVESTQAESGKEFARQQAYAIKQKFQPKDNVVDPDDPGFDISDIPF